MHVQTRLGARWRRRHRDRAWHEEQPAGGVFRNLAVAGVGQEGIELDETTIIEIRVRIRLDGDAVALDASLASMHRVRIGNHSSEEHTSELHSLMRISYAVFCLKQNHTHS